MTIGMELEWADVDRHAEIPPELGVWNNKDYTIVNSDGHANSIDGTTWSKGGEINTTPTDTAQEQALIVEKLAKLLNPTINYRCNLHVHVEPSVDLTQDVNTLKKVAVYLREAEPFVYEHLEPIRKPLEGDYLSDEMYKGAMRRYRRSLVSHHYRLPDARWEELLEAETPKEVYEAHAPPKWDGGRMWMIAPRPGMNLRSLWKHGTIEYRHFPGTADPKEIEDSCEWAMQFTQAAIDGQPSVQALYNSRNWMIAKFRLYIHELEVRYQETKDSRR